MARALPGLLLAATLALAGCTLSSSATGNPSALPDQASAGTQDPARAAAVVSRWASPQVDPAGGVTAILESADVRLTRDLAAALAAAGEEAASFTLAPRTLESVFLTITRDAE